MKRVDDELTRAYADMSDCDTAYLARELLALREQVRAKDKAATACAAELVRLTAPDHWAQHGHRDAPPVECVPRDEVVVIALRLKSAATRTSEPGRAEPCRRCDGTGGVESLDGKNEDCIECDGEGEMVIAGTSPPATADEAERAARRWLDFSAPRSDDEAKQQYKRIASLVALLRTREAAAREAALEEAAQDCDAKACPECANDVRALAARRPGGGVK